ncbi:Oligoribonuclease (3'-_5' exoribonuclease) [Phaffia rhodozyma]|uniref:Oligoribonuclease (3'->5' exoribonuclease) n=1 Tax=Phaffia rhodozyma TaxID=264483 RepID=A0A0F7SR39_PHARH|nr:Oligoribonuclease (3'->5' exoribonuclease) [Phaffia rhodozyma]
MYKKGLTASLLRRFPVKDAKNLPTAKAAKELRKTLTHDPLNPHRPSLASSQFSYNPNGFSPFPTSVPPPLSHVAPRINPTAFMTPFASKNQMIKSIVTPKVIEPSFKKKLIAADGPLVWIDCEMTGLDLENDRIIEIAVIITDGELRAVDEGISFIVQTPKEVLDKMGEWCTEQHGKTGLTQACIDSPHTHEYVEAEVLKYIKERIPEKRTGVLAGSSVHADAAFLRRPNGGMSSIIDWLHYRIVDVSTIKECVSRWYPTLVPIFRRARDADREIAHRALDDIQQSILELAQYKATVFVPPVMIDSSLQANSVSSTSSKPKHPRSDEKIQVDDNLKWNTSTSPKRWETEDEYLSTKQTSDQTESTNIKGTSLTKGRQAIPVEPSQELAE